MVWEELTENLNIQNCAWKESPWRQDQQNKCNAGFIWKYFGKSRALKLLFLTVDLFLYKKIAFLHYVDIELHLWMMDLSALSHSAKSSSKISNSREKIVYSSYFQTQCPRNHYLIVQGFLLKSGFCKKSLRKDEPLTS